MFIQYQQFSEAGQGHGEVAVRQSSPLGCYLRRDVRAVGLVSLVMWDKTKQRPVVCRGGEGGYNHLTAFWKYCYTIKTYIDIIIILFQLVIYLVDW